MSERGLARLALVGLTTIWGSTFVVVQTAIEHTSTFVLIGTRFLIAGLVISILRPQHVRAGLAATRPALALSLFMLVGFGLQTVGLRTTTPARSAFLTSLSVVLVPFLSLVARRVPRARVLLGVVLAWGGVVALFHPLGGEWGRGDTLTLLAAVSFSAYIVELERVARRHGAVAVVLAQCIAITPVALAIGIFLETPRLDTSLGGLASLAYLALVATALTFWLMTWAQARVEATEAAVIYTLEPVLAAAFSIALGREELSARLVLGGALIVLGTLASGTGSADLPRGPVEGARGAGRRALRSTAASR